MLLKDRVVAITGAAQPGGVGEAIARLALREGAARVIVTSRSADDARKAEARLGGGRVVGAALDVTDDASVARFAREHGDVDALAHNAGAPIAQWDRGFLDVPVADYARAYDVDVVGAARLTRALVPGMLARGRGSVVLSSSTAALGGYEFLPELAAAKAAAVGLMRSLASEFASRGVRANAVAYGNIATPGTLDVLSPDLRARLAAESPMKRWGTPEEAAGVVAFLLSDLSAFVNGQVIVVDGGTLMR